MDRHGGVLRCETGNLSSISAFRLRISDFAMILGRTSDNKIKIKSDSPKGLRAVSCGCCAPACNLRISVEISDPALKETLKNATNAVCNGQSRSWDGSGIWLFPNGDLLSASFDGNCFFVTVENEDFGTNNFNDRYYTVSEFFSGDSSKGCQPDSLENGPPEIVQQGIDTCYVWKRSRYSCTAGNFSINGASFNGYFVRNVIVSAMPQCWTGDTPPDPYNYPAPPDFLPLVSAPSFTFS